MRASVVRIPLVIRDGTDMSVSGPARWLSPRTALAMLVGVTGVPFELQETQEGRQADCAGAGRSGGHFKTSRRDVADISQAVDDNALKHEGDDAANALAFDTEVSMTCYLDIAQVTDGVQGLMLHSAVDCLDKARRGEYRAGQLRRAAGNVRMQTGNNKGDGCTSVLVVQHHQDYLHIVDSCSDMELAKWASVWAVVYADVADRTATRERDRQRWLGATVPYSSSLDVASGAAWS
jgi:hypothetical protein